MSIFDTVASSKIFNQSNNWFRDGDYVVDLTKTEIEKSAKKGENKVFAKCYFKVVSCKGLLGAPAPYEPGDEVKAFWNINNEFIAQNAKKLARAAVEQAFKNKGVAPEKIAEVLKDFDDENKVKPHLEDVYIKGMANGVRLKVSAFRKEGKEHTYTEFSAST